MAAREGGFMRLFIAIQLSDGMRAALGGVQDDLYRQGVRGNYTPAENLHLTLAFIGEYGDPERVLDVIRSVPFAPFELRLEGIGAFGDLWWVGLERSEALQNYVRKLRRALAEADIPFDRKRFTPHITLLRRANADMARLRGITVERVGITVDHPSLIRSDRGKGGMIYTEIE